MSKRDDGDCVYAIKNRDGSYIVGESAHRPNERLRQHVEGENSRHAERDGVRPAKVDWAHTKTGISDRSERERLERKLAHKLYNEGHRVYGNGLPRNKRGR
ncbi:MAG: GIY-YIG nuclease family protein [Myxococcaceae bacterium]|nr:MAG: GIY-YIG nuclease family protein [Myxococcaceae bacterium]